MVRTLSTKLRRSFVDRHRGPLSIRNANAPTVLTVSLIQSALVIGLALVAMLDASYRSSSVAPFLGAAAVVTAFYILSVTLSTRDATIDNAFDDDSLDNAEQLALIKERVSHDLRTPLNAVIGFSEIMQREVLGPVGNERYREYAGHIRKSAEHFQSTTEKTLAVTALLAAPSKAKLERVDLSVWAARHHAIERQVRPVFVWGNCANLDQALEHLVCAATTAAQAADASSTMTISLEDRFNARLHVDLTGAGLSMHTDARDALPGFDLSLLLAKLAAQAGGGVLTIDSKNADHWRATLSIPMAR